MSLVVPLQGTYYVTDVGFGDLPLHAMPITLEQDSQPVQDISGTFRAIFENENKTRFLSKNGKVILGKRNTMQY